MTFSRDWIIVETLAGSHLYGTNTPESDIDYRGICIPPFEVLNNPFINFEQKESETEEDTVIYALKKFFQLCSDCNPNIVELLFVTPETCRVWTDSWEYLLEDREHFLSQKAKYTFSGYAYQQLERIKRHRKWIVDPPKKKPERKDFGLDEMPLYSFERLQALLASPPEVIIPEMREYAIQEMKYREQKKYWDDFYQWQKTRNPKRFELESKFGYDTKHASHLYRLYSECVELLENKTITFPRPDKDFLLHIRNGGITYDELIELGESFKEKIDSIPTTLPKKPNYTRLSELYMLMIEKGFPYD